MPKTYTIKSGDQLLKIAVEQKVRYAELLALNPSFQANPNLILPGQVLTLPEPIVAKEEENKDDWIQPIDPNESLACKTGTVEGNTACQGTDIAEIMIFTSNGIEDFQVLTQEELDDLIEESNKMKTFMDDFQALTKAAPDANTASTEEIDAHKKQRQLWIDQAAHAGVIQLQKEKVESTPEWDDETLNALKAQQKTLQQRLGILEYLYGDKSYIYTSMYMGAPAPSHEKSTLVLYERVSKNLRNELSDIEKLIAIEEKNKEERDKQKDEAEEKKKAKEKEDPGKSSVQGAVVHNNKARFIHKTQYFRVVEVLLATQGLLLYIRADYIVSKKTASWREVGDKSNLEKARKSGASHEEQIKAAIKDIRGVIREDAKNGSLGKLEQVWLEKAFEDKALLGKWTFDSNASKADADKSLVAVSGEAQLMRFCANAEIKSVFQPAKGEVALGASLGSSFSLAEGFIKAEGFIPNAGGLALYMPYKDANGENARFAFGNFRSNSSMTLSCFVGVNVAASGEIMVSKNLDSEEELKSAGASILLSKNVNLSKAGDGPGAKVGVKAEGFAGAQVGGKLEGALEWKAPPPPKGSKATKAAKFEALASIAVTGNVSVGFGASWAFQLQLNGTEFSLYTQASITFGPGATGGFTTSVNFEKLWPLAKLIWEGLSHADYRTLECINREAYDFLSQAAYYFFAGGLAKDLEAAINSGADTIIEWWASRKDLQKEIDNIVKTLKESNGTFNDMDLATLPPETIGMLLDTLLETPTFWSRHEEQEDAINILLTGSIGKSWRKFEEVLVRVNQTGKKDKDATDSAGTAKVMFRNLRRINALLDNDKDNLFYDDGNNQQTQFNEWMESLLSGPDDPYQRDKLALPRK